MDRKAESPPRRIPWQGLAIAAAFLALVNLPCLLGWAGAPPGQRFAGFANVHEDAWSYLAKMRQGWEGSWRYEDRFTTEPHHPAILFIFYAALGHVARWTGLSLLTDFHLARLGGQLALLAALGRMIGRLGLGPRAAGWALFLALFGQGIGWCFRFSGTPPEIVEDWLSEAYALQSCVNFPHLALSTALLVFTLDELDAWADGGRGARSLLAIALAAHVLVWLHPRLILNVLAIGGATAALRQAGGEGHPRRWIAGLATAALAGAPPAALMWFSTRGEPVWEAWSATPTPSPTPLQMLEAFGLLWPLAVVGGLHIWKRRARCAAPLIAWGAVGLALAYLPLDSQRRLLQSFGVPLGVLAGIGVAALMERAVQLRAPVRWAMAGAAGLLLAGSAVWYVGMCSRYSLMGIYPWSYANERTEAMDWLAAHAEPTDVVLCAPKSGMMIPALAGCRVAAGHWAETIGIAGKSRLIAEFYRTSTPAPRRDDVIMAFHARYVLFSKIEWYLADQAMFDPAKDPARWEKVWGAPGYSIYRPREPEQGNPSK